MKAHTDNIYEIYWAYDLDNICRYVGIGQPGRHRHVNSNKSHNAYLNNYVSIGNIFRIVVETRTCDYSDLLLEETQQIAHFGREIDNSGCLWNVAVNGNGLPGMQNGMYGRRHTDTAKKSMSDNSPSYIGILNPNYGKKHSIESKLKMGIQRSYVGKNNPKAKSILVDGIVYDTINDAAKHYNVTRQTAYNRIKKGVWELL